MEPPAFTPTDADRIAAARRLMELDRQIRSGLGWFYWIAGLSLINSITYLMNVSSSFVVGLGVTQLIDGLALAISQEVTSEIGLLIRIAGYAFDLALIVVFILFGVFGRKRVRWVIITGMILYGLDTALVLAFGDWISAIFHLLALWGIWTGLNGIKKIKAIEAALPANAPQFPQSVYSNQSVIATEKPGFNKVFLGVLIAILAILLVVTLVMRLAQ